MQYVLSRIALSEKHEHYKLYSNTRLVTARYKYAILSRLGIFRQNGTLNSRRRINQSMHVRSNEPFPE